MMRQTLISQFGTHHMDTQFQDSEQLKLYQTERGLVER